MNSNLCESNFLLFGMKHYDVPICTDLEEFNNDISRLRYINRGLRLAEINIQLILNHLVVLYNVFGDAATSMILYKVEKDVWHSLLPFLIYLNRLDDDHLTVCLRDSKPLNEEVIRKLREL